ncbi:MAG TPA: VOC family protein [Gemmatimonadales bacterium]|nr:VOC family protein [Gemmatimonadales bacterium]
MAKVTGIGGVFFKSRKDHKALAAWYQKHLGMPLESWGGAMLQWAQDPTAKDGVTVWHVAEPGTKWFAPSDSSFMINYRVDDLTGLLANLKAAGVEVIKGPDVDDNGSFAWIVDPDGNKVELWEPKAEE